MNSTLARTVRCCLLIAAAGGAGAVHAQAVPPLTAFVNDPANNATAMQQQAGAAVQRMCAALGVEGGLRLTGAKGDLFQRCNELVETARVFQTGTTVTGRTLGYTDGADLLAAVQQVSGEEIAAQGALSTQASAGQFANISGRLSALRFGGSSAAARGRVARLDDPPPRILLASLNPQDAQPVGGGSAGSSASGPLEQPFGWFIESSYGFGDRDQTANEDAFDFDSISATTGTDYNFGSAVVGVAFGYDRYLAEFDNAQLVTGGEVEVEGVSGSLFGGFFGGGFTLNGIATYGRLESEVTRWALYESLNAACNPVCGAARALHGNPDGDYLALGVTLGYEFNLGQWDLAPSLSASYRDVTIDSYDEVDTFSNGGLALRYDEQSIESTRSILGVVLSRPISRSFGVLTPSLRAEWHHEFEDEARAVRAKYVVEDTLVAASAPQDFGCAISCFTMLSDQPEADYGVASAGVALAFPQRLQLYFVYEALIGAGSLSGNSIAAGLRGQF